MKTAVVYPAPVGDLLLTCEDGAVTGLRRADGAAPEGEPNALTAEVFRQLDEYFAGQRREFDLPLRLDGTPFQRAVWEELCRIPYGEIRSYQAIASAICRPRAYRAVGSANHCNPIWIIVPCHRVIGAQGALLGYGGGVEMKRALLELEAKHK